MVPVAGILITRRIDQRAELSAGGRSSWEFLPLVFGAILALMVTHADVRLANAARVAATDISNRFDEAGHALFFQGHWGFQHYMESHGYEALDVYRTQFARGDILVILENNTNIAPPNPQAFSRVITFQGWGVSQDYDRAQICWSRLLFKSLGAASVCSRIGSAGALSRVALREVVLHAPRIPSKWSRNIAAQKR